MKSLPVAVCVLPARPENSPRGVLHPNYVHEILAHAGLCYQNVSLEDLDDSLSQIRVLVTVGEMELPAETQQLLTGWVNRGGAWLSIAGVCGCAELFGVAYAQPGYRLKWGAAGACVLGEGYLAPASSANGEAHRILQHLEIPLHFFNGLAVVAADTETTPAGRTLDIHGRPIERVGVVERQVGSGHCLLIAPDAVGAVQHIQQGRAITRDGSPAPDGTAPVTDGVLKSDDGMVLDWYFDRQEVPGVPGLNAFLQPVADQWREVILRAIFHLAEATATPLPLLWLYPRNLPAIAHMSHDSDNNVPEKAERLLELLDESQIKSTWCIIEPGYARELIDRIRDAGHELAMHYDAVTPGRPWGQEQFDSQWEFLVALFGEKPVSNKNHYTRWEGDTEFFDWCALRGIEIDQSKGASKTGEVGFNFGTCHPHFPLAPDGRMIDVLELPTPTQDLEVFAPTAVAHALLASAQRNHGVLHVLFHPGHTDKPEVGVALLEIVAAAKSQGLEWWTAAQLNSWERARRTARWTATQSGAASLSAGKNLDDATLLVLDANARGAHLNGVALESTTVTRYGFEFQSAVVGLKRGENYSLAV